MAIDVCSETSSSPIIGPRISFSRDLIETEFIPSESNTTRSDSMLLNPTIDFDFCFDQIFSQHLSSADEIFANGKILPFEFKKITPHQESNQSDPTPSTSEVRKPENPNNSAKKKRLIEFLSSSFDPKEDEKAVPKPFWQFRRSNSLNCDNGRGGKGILRSLQFLTRSNSTGSAPNQKPKAIRKQHSLKEGSVYSMNSSVQSFNHNRPYDKTPKRPYLKSSSKSYGNGVRVSPVLNIHPTYIGRGTVSLFGIANSLFSGKKSMKKKKNK